MSRLETATDHRVEQIIKAVDPLPIILFGSAARGEGHADSNIDLLVVMPDGTNGREVAKQLYLEISGGGVSFDVLVTTPTILEREKDNPGLIYRKILEEGREVYTV